MAAVITQIMVFVFVTMHKQDICHMHQSWVVQKYLRVRYSPLSFSESWAPNSLGPLQKFQPVASGSERKNRKDQQQGDSKQGRGWKWNLASTAEAQILWIDRLVESSSVTTDHKRLPQCQGSWTQHCDAHPRYLQAQRTIGASLAAFLQQIPPRRRKPPLIIWPLFIHQSSRHRWMKTQEF